MMKFALKLSYVLTTLNFPAFHYLAATPKYIPFLSSNFFSNARENSKCDNPEANVIISYIIYALVKYVG